MAMEAVLPPMANGGAPIDTAGGECRVEPGQHYVGRTATAELGAAALQATGAGTLRWTPLGSALTMDYRRDRLTIAYGADLVVTRVACG